ncbi:hypothetical protein MMC25_005532 [Agyrium rufum]|nr:hypothetical protein [Agyrium rufum]
MAETLAALVADLPASADFHVHLRDDDMMRTVVPTIRKGGVNTVYVMPNLVPPITTVSYASEYQKKLQSLAPDVQFLMSLYLHPSITPGTIVEAKKAGISGIKSYPAGVTTNSSSGVVDYETFYPVFAEMERQNMALNLHGECPSGEGITVHNAEEEFLPTLRTLHEKFPRLRIILEHCTTAAAIKAVQACGQTVAGTITAHHLFLTSEDWQSNNYNFCKPVAKTPQDRALLLKTAASGNPKFFLGSDSAPHSASAKEAGAAGVFTQPYVTQLVVKAFQNGIREGLLSEAEVTRALMEAFLGKSGRAFYGLPPTTERIAVLPEQSESVVDYLPIVGEDKVVPFLPGSQVASLWWP